MAILYGGSRTKTMTGIGFLQRGDFDPYNNPRLNDGEKGTWLKNFNLIKNLHFNFLILIFGLNYHEVIINMDDNKGQVTQQDIAWALNVSRETVTKALNDHPKVSAETKKQIKKLAEQLGYTPNLIARNLVSRQSKTIGIIVPKVAHSFFASSLEALFEVAHAKGYSVIPMVSFEDEANERANINTLLSMRVDGIIANISQNLTDIKSYETILARQVPLVFFDRIAESPSFSYVKVNSREAAFTAVDYALRQGFIKPAHLGGYTHINIGRERMEGFKDALAKHNVPVKEEWIIEGGFEKKDGYKHAKKLLGMSNRPDFIFAFNDSVAWGVYEAANELNIRIPKDLGLIGFGNLEFGSLLSPSLTTIDMPIKEIAEKAMQILLDRVEGRATQEKVHQVQLPAKLIVRESCAR